MIDCNKDATSYLLHGRSDIVNTYAFFFKPFQESCRHFERYLMNQQQLPFEFPSKMDFYFKIGFSKPCLFICKENVRNIHIVIWQNYKQIFQKLRSLHSRFPDNIIVFSVQLTNSYLRGRRKNLFLHHHQKIEWSCLRKTLQRFFYDCVFLSFPTIFIGVYWAQNFLETMASGGPPHNTIVKFRPNA